MVEVCRKSLTEEKEPMLEIKEEPRREYGTFIVHLPSQVLTWELCLGKSGIALG